MRGVHFTISTASPCAADFYEIRRTRSTHRRNHVKFLVDRFRGYGVLTPQKLPFHIDLLRRPYNSVALPCDTVIQLVLLLLLIEIQLGIATLQTTANIRAATFVEPAKRSTH